MVINTSKLPAGFGLESRKYWLGQFERALKLIVRAEQTIPEKTWSDLTPENMIKYTIMLRESRGSIVEQGIYDKQGLVIMKKIRCSVNRADSECTPDSKSF